MDFTPSQTLKAFDLASPQASGRLVVLVFSSTPLPGFIGRDFITTTGSSATSHRIALFLSFLLKTDYSQRRQCQASPVTSGSLNTAPSSITLRDCPHTGRRDIMHAYPPAPPNQVHFRYVPYSFYGFLRTSPLASDALASRIAFPVDRAASVSSPRVRPERSTDRVRQQRWANIE